MGGEVVGKQLSCVNNEGGTLWRAEPSQGKLWIINSQQLTNDKEDASMYSHTFEEGAQWISFETMHDTETA